MFLQNNFLDQPPALFIALALTGALITWLVCRYRYRQKKTALLADFRLARANLQETLHRQAGELEQLQARLEQADKTLELKKCRKLVKQCVKVLWHFFQENTKL